MNQHNCSVEQRPARQAHNLEVAGSNPAAAIDGDEVNCVRVGTGSSSVKCPRCEGPMGRLEKDIKAYLCKNRECQCMVDTLARDVGRFGDAADQGLQT